MKAVIVGQDSPFWEPMVRALRSAKFTVEFEDTVTAVHQSAITFVTEPVNNSKELGQVVLVIPFVSAVEQLRKVDSFTKSTPSGVVIYRGEGTTEYLAVQCKQIITSLFGFSPASEFYLGAPVVSQSITQQVKHAQPESLKASPIPAAKTRPRRITLKRPRIAPLISVVLMLITIVSLPFVVLAVSTGFTYTSVKLASRGDYKTSKTLMKISSHTSSLATSLFLPLTHVPLVGKEFSYFHDISALVKKTNQLGIVGVDTVKVLRSIVTSLTQYQPLSWNNVSEQLSLSLSLVYRDSAFLRAQADSMFTYSHVLGTYSSLVDSLDDIPSFQAIVRHLPELVGANTKATYLVLFQNNMELRPTGGFIGSFALLTFDHGKLVSREIHDVYDADGMISGYVEPPEPIRKYLGEASWHMRDANWDPDFPTSARRVSWFLEKAMDRKVDGVVAIDLSVLQSLLNVTGPLTIEGYNDTITSENMYELIQKRVEDNFFPGTIQKKTYLAQTLEQVLGKLGELDSSKQVMLVREFGNLLSEGGIQLWFENDTVEQSIKDLQWDGRVRTDGCGTNCETIIQSINEANVGVNKANVAVDRSISSHYSYVNGILKGEVVLTLTHKGGYRNNGNESYKVYTRLLTPLGAEVDNVRIESVDEFSVLSPEIKQREAHQEAGVLVTVAPGISSKVTFVWDKEIAAGAYQIVWQKQSGIAPVNLTLTAPGKDVYNTTLRGIERLEFTLP